MTTAPSTTSEHVKNASNELEEMDITSENYRWNAAMAYLNVSPTLSRVLMSQFLKNTDLAPTLKPRVQRAICQFCGSIFVPNNHTVRITSKSKISKNIKKLIHMQKDTSWKIKGIHKKYLDSVHTRASTMIYKCLKCCKCTKIPLENPHKQLFFNKTSQNAIPQVTNTPIPVNKKKGGIPVRVSEEKKLNEKQLLLISTQKPSSKKKKQKKKKNKGNFCQLKTLLKNHNSETSMKTRLEAFLSSV